MNSRQRRMQDTREGEILGIRKATFKDAVYIMFFFLVVAGLVKQIFPVLDKVKTEIITAISTPIAQAKVKLAVVTPAPIYYIDERSETLTTFLQTKNSPLAPFANLIVEEADKYDIGWTKIAAISGKESGYGIHMPEGSHNAWGIGGNQFMYFESWEKGIKYVSWLIGTSYKWNENKGIQQKYCPDSDGCASDWAQTVTAFTHEILAIKGK